MGQGLKRTIAFLFFLLAGIVIGTVLANLCANISFLSWLAYEMSVGLATDSPMILDLIVFKLAFGFSLTVDPAQIICIIASLIIYNKTCRGL